MLTKNYLKSLFLLLCMISGVGTAWAEEVTYTISSKNTLSTSGTEPSGSSATIAETYSTTKQMTSGNSQTLTLTGYAGYKITGIVLSMKSNSKGGAGKLSYSTDGGTSFSYIIGSSDSGEAFSSEKWYGSYSTSYVDVTKSNLDISCGSSNVIIKIEATVNSLYCQSYKISYESQAPASPLSSIALSGTYPTSFYVGDAFSHEGMTVTATYEDESSKDVTGKAVFSDYDMSSAGNQTVIVSYTENEITKTAEYNITVSERPKYTVTFSDGGSETQASYGAEVTLPSREGIGGYTFAGWSETNVAVETTTAPTIIPAGSYTPTANITLYPVYTRTEGGGGTQNKTASVTIADYASANSWTSGTKYTTIIMDENITVTGDGAGNNSKFYNSSNPHNWRFYATDKGKFTVSTTVGELKNVSVTYTGNTLTYNGNNVTSNTSVAVSGTSATFSVSGSSSNSQVSKIDVDYTIAGTGVTYYFSAPVASAVELPVIEFAENPFLFSTTAIITCATDGATIKYSFDGENWNDYSEALTITATTTIYAKATKGNDESNIATATVTKNLAEPTVAISGDLTVDLNGDTNVEAGTLTAAVTYNEAAVDGATVTWSGNNDDVATINAETGAVTIKSRGTVTFTATYAGNSDYKEATATKEITVIDSKAPGTQGRPYTVAEAIDAIDNSGDVTGVYATGIVSQIVTAYNSQYGNISYNISADGTTEGAQLQAYRGKSYNGESFASEDDIQVGDVVVIYGNLKKYNTTYEFDQNNQLVSLSRKSVPSLVFEKNAYTVKVGGDLTITASSEDSDGAITYTSSNEEVATIAADGKVTALKVGETTITATIAETEDFKSTTAEVTLAVVDARDFVTEITALAPTTVYVGQEGTFTLTETPAGEATYSYESSDDEVLLVADNEFVGVQAGQANVTVTATPQDEVNYQTATFVANVTVSYKYEAPAIADDSFNKTYTVTIPAIAGADIYYTLDGTTPTASSTKYTEAFVLDATTTVKAIAIDTDGLVSPVATATYTKEPLKNDVIALTNTLTFNEFSGLGSYSNDRSDYLVANDGDTYKWTGNQYCYNSQYVALQMRAKGNANGTGTISSTVTSKKGFKLTLEFTDNATPSVYVGEDIQNATSSTSTSAVYEIESTSATLTIEAGSKATYITSITLSPLKDNRTLAFSEPTTEILVNATATNAATATPAGTITYTSSDETVATVDAEGKVTGMKIGTATITATVAEDADYNEATASYEVTVNGIPAATDIALTATDGNEAPVALNEIKVGTIGTFVATYTKAATDVTVTYTSDATDVLTIDDDLFEALKGGTANVTVTITPDDTEHYVAVSKVFEVTLLYAQMGTTELTIVNGEVEEQTSGNTLYGTNINLTAMLAANYDGTVTASLTNNAIANVAIEGENITITPKAVGTTTITFTAPATANFEGEVNKTYELTVTAPEGQTACEVIPAEVVLNETFSKCNSNGGNDGDFGTSSTTSISSPNSATDVEGWTLTTAYEADGCVKFGSSKNAGSATTPSLSVSEGKAYTLTFNAAPWNTESATMTVSVSGGTINGKGTVTTATMTTGEWNSFEYNILATAADMTIEFTCSQKRFFLDEVKVEIPEVAPAIPDVTIAESGYASFCCEYPLDFSEANENYKAWYVSEVSGTTVTFKQIKGKIAGGVPFFLYGEKGTYHLQVAAESTETLSGNMLVGTLAPTYVESEVGDYTNFGLSEGSFKKMNTGVVKANKAYLPILTENVPAGARLNIIFDEGTSTGISSVNTDNLNKNNDVYNLNGQRVENMKKGGLYIVNGKKVFMKGQR